MMQVVASLAMEEPASGHAEALRDARTRILQAIVPLDPAQVVRGQFRGYRDEDSVARDSSVETFAAVRLSIDSMHNSTTRLKPGWITPECERRDLEERASGSSISERARSPDCR